MDDLVPIFLYKYTPIESWLPDLLSGNSLKFSQRDSFNDPFDSRPGSIVKFNTKESRQYLQKKIKTYSSLKPAERLLESSRIARSQKIIHSDEHEDVKKMLDSVGILSLATTWENLLMWAHYADHHKGICVSFKSHKDTFKIALKVIYQDELPVIIRPQDDPELILEKAFLIKSKCWEYEDEWRIIKSNFSQYEKDTTYYDDKELQKVMMDCNGPGIYKFNPEAIESVTIGLRTSASDEKFVIKSMMDSSNKIPLYKAISSKTRYEIERKLIGIY